MRYAYSVILFICSVLAFYFSTRIIYRKKKYNYNIAFSITAIGSSIWSFGYGLMFYFDDISIFLIARIVGIIGLFIFILSAQYMIGIVAKLNKKFFYYFNFETFISCIILFFLINPASVVADRTDNGIVTTFVNPVLSIVYTSFTLLVALSFLFLTITIQNKKFPHRIRVFGRNALIVLGLIFLGMIVDTIMPALGINLNIPSSSICQFIGLEILYFCVHSIDRNVIDFSNLTGYMYQSFKSPILVFDSDDTLKIVNNSAREVFSINNDEKLEEFYYGKNIFIGNKTPDFSNFKETIIINSFYEPKNMQCRIYIDPIFDQYKDYIGYIVMVSDITELINNAKALEESREEAVRANKAKSQFLANMSHEIRTPMNSIIGFSELALEDSLNDTSREYFEDINRSAQSLLSIINDILDISKIESGKMEVINTEYSSSDVFKDVSRIIKMQSYRKKLQFKMEISDDFPDKLYGDRVKVRAMLVNLLNNGIKYTNEGYVKLYADFIKDKNDEGILHFEISDTGIGIKKEELAGIFNMFQRVDEANNSGTEGTGLGLSITKGYAELLGGSIKVESEYGKGTTFILEFRQKVLDDTPVNMSDSKTKNETVKKLKLKDVKVLAVDDIDMNIKLIEMILQNYNANVDTCLSGAEALNKCVNNSYDLILMDQMMPEMDGIETMKKIRELPLYQNEACKIVVLTANAIDGAKDSLLELGFDDYLSKPIDIPELEKVLKNSLSNSKFY